MQIVHYKLYLTFNLHVVSPPDREMPKKTILSGLEVEHEWTSFYLAFSQLNEKRFREILEGHLFGVPIHQCSLEF